jgi:nicotinamidase-related amidase
MRIDGALLVVDVQVGMFESRLISPVYNGDQLLTKIKELIEKARSFRVPVIYVQHSGGHGHPLEYGGSGWHIHPTISPSDGDLVVEKRTPDSFYQTTLRQELEAKKIKKLTLVGIQTEYCVDTTCRRAFSLGYDVTLVKDGHSTWDREVLTAPQIINHHNEILGSWFATLKEAARISFEEYIT